MLSGNLEANPEGYRAKGHTCLFKDIDEDLFNLEMGRRQYVFKQISIVYLPLFRTVPPDYSWPINKLVGEDHM